MSTEKTPALVIRQADFSNTSRVVTFMTREFGKVACVAKGAKRLKSPFDAALDLLTHCGIVFIHKTSGALDILTEASFVHRFKPYAGELNCLYAGYYIAELLDSLTEPHDPHHRLFDETVPLLTRLEETPNWRRVVLRFELLILEETGQLPSFDACALCGRLLEDDPPAATVFIRSGFICPTCLNDATAEDGVSRPVSAGTAHILRVFSEDSNTWQDLPVTSAQAREVRALMNSLIAQTLGKRPRMHGYLRD